MFLDQIHFFFRRPLQLVIFQKGQAATLASATTLTLENPRPSARNESPLPQKKYLSAHVGQWASLFFQITQKSLEITQKSLEITQKSVEITQKSLEIIQKSLEITQKSLEITQKSLEITQKFLEILRWLSKGPQKPEDSQPDDL